MSRSNFLTAPQRLALTTLAKRAMVEHRVARRANAIILLDKGWSYDQVAAALLLDDSTVRSWLDLFERDGITGLESFLYEGRGSQMTGAQEAELVSWITGALPRTTREIGAWIDARFGIVYESRSGLVAMLHRLGLEHRRPEAVSRKLDPAKQKAFIAAYEALLNGLADDEAVLFADAVHPTHTARPVGCWAPKDTKVALDQASGRDRLNIHGAVDLETGKTVMKDVLTVDAASTIALLISIEMAYPGARLIHLFLDNARYHHARLVQDWLARPGCRIRLHFVPAYCPHLNPIERLWGLMHRNVTHNKSYPSYREFADAMLRFLRTDVPAKWGTLCDSVSDNFRVIDPANFRILT